MRFNVGQLHGKKLRVAAQVRQSPRDLLLPLPGEGCCKHRLQLLQPGQGGVVPDTAQRLPHLVAQTVTDALRDLLLGAEVMVHRPFGKLCGINDVLQGGILVALLEEKQGGGVQDLFNGLFRVFVARHGIHSFLQTAGLYAYYTANCKQSQDICAGLLGTPPTPQLASCTALHAALNKLYEKGRHDAQVIADFIK